MERVRRREAKKKKKVPIAWILDQLPECPTALPTEIGNEAELEDAQKQAETNKDSSFTTMKHHLSHELDEHDLMRQEAKPKEGKDVLLSDELDEYDLLEQETKPKEGKDVTRMKRDLEKYLKCPSALPTVTKADFQEAEDLFKTKTAGREEVKGPLKYLLRPLLRKNQFAVTQRTYACIEPNLDNIY